uniref:THAP domain-containing protein 1 n=1 Tax=Astyanax mexicanus TaxID=7994 RepID=A0A3B1JYG6_ASTMX
MVRTCDYPGCSNKDVADSPHSFHRIPVTDIALRQLWILAMGFHVDTKVVKMKKLRVCGAHFSEDDYVSPCPGNRKKRILKKSAVPAPQVNKTIYQDSLELASTTPRVTVHQGYAKEIERNNLSHKIIIYHLVSY